MIGAWRCRGHVKVSDSCGCGHYTVTAKNKGGTIQSRPDYSICLLKLPVFCFQCNLRDLFFRQYIKTQSNHLSEVLASQDHSLTLGPHHHLHYKQEPCRPQRVSTTSSPSTVSHRSTTLKMLQSPTDIPRTTRERATGSPRKLQRQGRPRRQHRVQMRLHAPIRRA
jgi:hypothetical protein